VIFIQRVKLPPNLIRLLTRFYSPVIYDFDDAFYTQPNWKTEETGDADKFDEVLATVSTVVAGSPALAQYARQYSDNVYPLLTPIPRENHERIDHSENGKITIGWIGYPENLHYFSTIRSTLTELLDKHDDLHLMIITADLQQDYPLYDRADVDYYEWGRSTYLKQMKQADIGIRPLINEEWTRAKSHTSIVEFMTLGIPVVVSPVGILEDVIEHGISGFHATSESEWKMCIERLLNNHEKRVQMGMAARKAIDDHGLWNDQYAKDLTNIINKSIGKQKAQ
jgi:glycosyltransferase involved in cell wall biosynthesis